MEGVFLVLPPKDWQKSRVILQSVCCYAYMGTGPMRIPWLKWQTSLKKLNLP